MINMDTHIETMGGSVGCKFQQVGGCINDLSLLIIHRRSMQAHQKSIDSMWHWYALGAWRSAYSFQMLTCDSMVTMCMHMQYVMIVMYICTPVGSRAPVQCERKMNHQLLSESLTLCENE
jgi:hypothetical protein